MSFARLQFGCSTGASPVPHGTTQHRPVAAHPPRSAGLRVVCRSEPDSKLGTSETGDAAASVPPPAGSVRDALADATAAQQRSSGRRQAGSTDWVSSQLTRRFGIAGGLAWVGVLTFGVVSEQVKTRLEQADEEKNTKDVSGAQEVVTPEGLRYTELKRGGGAPPQNGYLVVLSYKAYADGVLFEDTEARGKPIVFRFGARPLAGGVCPGVETALRSMRAGGRRRVVVPPALGFGAGGTTLRPTEHAPDKQGNVPPNATLEYDLELLRVSIPPS